MTTATTSTLFACLMCVGVVAAAQDGAIAFACNLKAISAAERPRYNRLVKHIRAAARDRTEIPNGYTFKLDSKTITIPEVAEWIGMERLCCPFLTLQLSVTGNHMQWVLTLSGPKGVKPVLDAEFPFNRE